MKANRIILTSVRVRTSVFLAVALVLLAAFVANIGPVAASSSQQAKLTPGDGLGGDFGYSVAIDGDTAIVGARSDLLEVEGSILSEGAAYIFVRSGATWTEQAKLAMPVNNLIHPSGQFGTSVAIDGDTVIVGAPLAFFQGSHDEGLAYVFVRTGSTWQLQAQLRAGDATDSLGDKFGWSVALDGDTAVVGAPAGGANESGYGRAYVFRRAGSTWQLESELLLAEAIAGVNARVGLGYSVAVSSDRALVSTPFAPIVSNVQQFHGAGHVFVRNGSTWTHEATLTASDALLGREVGWSVALDGDTALLGARGEPGHRLRGAAYVFGRGSVGWQEQAKLTPTNSRVEDEFGCSVALDGNTALIGNQGVSNAASAGRGAAHVFTRGGTAWAETDVLNAADGTEDNVFGGSVALDGGTALVGALFAHRSVDSLFPGASYVFVLSGGQPPDTDPPTITTPGDITVDATSPAGATVNFAVTASDNVGLAALACTPASGSVFPIGTTQVRCNASDAAGNTAQAAFNVTVRSATDQILSLIQRITGGTLPPNIQARLVLALGDPQNTPAVCTGLRVFIGIVRNLSGRSIPVAEANQLIADATRIRAVLGCN